MNPVDCIPNIDNLLKTFNLHNQRLKIQQSDPRQNGHTK